MPQRPSFMTVSPEEIERVKQFLHTSILKGNDGKWRGYRQRRRAQIIFFSLQGKTSRKIAREFHCSEQTVWKWRKVYKQKGIEGLKGKYRSNKL
ncbi:MAG: helix-turn-helix domain-containing protein [Planctomycetota bacterium]